MIQLDDEQYQRLVKDADDNRQIVKITRMLIATAVALLLYFTYVWPLLKININLREAQTNQGIAIAQANNNVRIREIESDGLTTEEYFQWLKIRVELEEN